jgi:uncharacterized membrane protein
MQTSVSGNEAVFRLSGTTQIKEPFMSLPLHARIAAALSFAFAGATFAAPVYHLVDLGANYLATAINKNGVVVGYKTTGFGVPSIYRDGHWRAIEQGVNGEATGVDAAGDAIGWEWDGPATFWPHGHVGGIAVEPKFPASVIDLAGVNDHQVIAGSAVSRRDKDWHCFRWEDGVGKDLHAPGSCVASGINRAGWIIGTAISPAGTPHEGFVWTFGNFHWFDEQPTAAPSQINDEGHIAGVYDSPDRGFGHAFLYDGTQFTDIGVAPPEAWQSWANGLNNHDEIVGHSANGFGDWLYLYTGGQMMLLTPLIDNLGNWDLTTVAGIDDAGDIIGTGNIAGVGHSWMAVRVSN